MRLISVPNVSEGRNSSFLDELKDSVEARGGRVLDIHSDPVHNRSVLTAAGTDDQLVEGMVALADRCTQIDLTKHQGVHPRLGGLDVCPFVPLNSDLDHATAVAVHAAKRIAGETGLSVYLYGSASPRESRSLPSLRKGGLEALAERARAGLAPDFGPQEIDLRRGVVCVGSRGPLVAFNVWLRCGEVDAKRIAARVRTTGGGPSGIRALGLQIEEGISQVSMNLTDPRKTGIDEAFAEVAHLAKTGGIEISATEIVGLPPAVLMPNPQKEAARLLLAPGRSLETVLQD